MGGQRTKWRRNIAENFNRLSRAHERYRRQTDGRRHIANVNVTFAKSVAISEILYIAIYRISGYIQQSGNFTQAKRS